jgi:hypothetical protein
VPKHKRVAMRFSPWLVQAMADIVAIASYAPLESLTFVFLMALSAISMRTLVPTIAYFYGIAIRMFFKDHPPPHFFASYSGHEANVSIATGEVIEGISRPTPPDLSGNGRWRIEANWRIIGEGRGPVGRSPGFVASTMIKVARVKYLDGHRLRATFSDGMAGEFDFSAIVENGGPMAEPLRDPLYFARVFLEDGAPTWPNGYDVAPGWLRREIEAAGALTRDAAA